MVIPKYANHDSLNQCCRFRENKRIPILIYFYELANSSIWRSSEPKVGIFIDNPIELSKEEDVNYINQIKDLSKKLIICDTRKKVLSGNMFLAGGYEKEQFYKGLDYKICELPNLEEINLSIDKANKIGKKNLRTQKSMSLIEESRWLEYQHMFLEKAYELSECLKQGSSLLIHGKEGWDKSCILSSLVQIIIDPYYRTIEGFIVLVEKEWISLGHQFVKRLGLEEKKQNESCPIFILFLECLLQLLNISPHSFEFNNTFVLYLMRNLYNNKYGTFLVNCEKVSIILFNF